MMMRARVILKRGLDNGCEALKLPALEGEKADGEKNVQPSPQTSAWAASKEITYFSMTFCLEISQDL